MNRLSEEVGKLIFNLIAWSEGGHKMSNLIELDEKIKEELLAKSAKCGVDPSELLNKYVSEGLRNDISVEESEEDAEEFIEYMKKHHRLLEDWEVAQRKVGYTPEELEELFEELSVPGSGSSALDLAIWCPEDYENVEDKTVEKGESK